MSFVYGIYACNDNLRHSYLIVCLGLEHLLHSQIACSCIQSVKHMQKLMCNQVLWVLRSLSVIELTPYVNES